MSEELVLPTKKSKAERVNPKILVIYSQPKVGKTTVLSGLDDCLILDFEDGAGFVDAMKINIDSLAKLREVGTKILAANKPYKRIAVDTVTAMEDMCRGLALNLYKKTPIGKNFDGDNVLTLPNGAGYGFLREAVESVLKYIYTLADEIILIGHLREKLIGVAGKETSANDIDLTGKIRTIVCTKADAIGLLIRKDDQNILTFKTKDDTICGARADHLRNQEIIVGETIDGEYKTYWERIYK